MSRNIGIDYSKWDHFDDSDEEDEPIPRPRVTTLKTPSRISTSWDGSVNIHPSVPNSCIDINRGEIENNDISTQRVTESLKKSVNSNKDSKSSQTSSPIPEGWVENGGIAYCIGRNDPFKTTKLYWSQDRYNVLVRVPVLPKELPSKCINIKWDGKIYRYVDRFNAVGTQTSSVPVRLQVYGKVSEKSGINVILEETLPHPIHFHEDSEDELDWAVEYDHTGEDRYVALTFPKASPMEGLTLNWKIPFLGVEVKEDGINMQNATRKQKEFQQAWDIAHTKFREKIKSKKPPFSL